MNVLAKEQSHQIEQLQHLLTMQMDMFRQGDSNGKNTEALFEQTNLLVSNLSQKGTLKLKQFAKQRENLRKLYEQLQLAITAQKQDTERQLNVVRKGTKMIGTYRSNI
jgi:hypothetical protein